ncbi:MAG: acetolactate synthase large subunit, partial [Microbacteriaceae bacterium]|nr:acetolactate synthase large subunit [Microbacteriaceae bacterium]
ELLKLAETVGAPVVTTLMARGAFPDSHKQHLGMPGMHGTVPAVLAIQESDLLVSLGARFDDRVTGKPSEFAPNAKVVHVDIDPAEISKIRLADVPIVGDAKEVIADLTVAFTHAAKGAAPDLDGWWARLDKLREQYPLGYDEPTDGLLSPQYVIERIGAITGPEGIYAAGVGQHQMWAAQFIKYERPNAWLNSGGAGTMGYGLPAAMGAKVAEPERTVWAIDGDGCFQMTNQELATCTINDIPIKVAIINNSSLGMVRQWQTLFYEGRHSFTDLNTGHGTAMVPDFVKMADAYGALGIRVTKKEEVDAAIRLANETNDRPVVIDFIVSRDSMVWPMVPQGVGNSSVQYARDHAPEWEEE